MPYTYGRDGLLAYRPSVRQRERATLYVVILQNQPSTNRWRRDLGSFSCAVYFSVCVCAMLIEL